jgi:hypothetical protein
VIVYEEPGLYGLELWCGIARGASLYQLRERKEEYFHALLEFLVRLHRGEERTLRRAAGFGRVIVCGGEALHPALGPILCTDSLPFSVAIDGCGTYAARRGACSIFETMQWRRGAALDVGQLQLKVMTVEQRCCLPRDESLLPFGAQALDYLTGRARLRDFVRQGLERIPEPPDGVVLALPVALDSEGVAQPSTYPGLYGPVDEIFADLFDCPWIVLNDAVLAALSFRPERREKTLVVTLGFGIGGALWDL